jgi:hypothetical protein
MNIKDDFSFQEIFQIIKKNSRQFFFIFVVITLIGFLFIFLSSVKYRYSESFKVPTYYNVEQRVIVEVFPNRKLIEDILLQHLPSILLRYSENHPNTQFTFSDNDISYFNDSNISNIAVLSIINNSFNLKISTNGYGDIYLSSTGKIKAKEFYETLFAEIEKAVKESSDSYLTVIEKNFEAHLTELENQLNKQHQADGIMNKPGNASEKEYLVEGMFLQQQTNKDTLLAERILNLKMMLGTLQPTKVTADFVFSKSEGKVTEIAIILALLLAFFVSFFVVLFITIFQSAFKKLAGK